MLPFRKGKRMSRLSLCLATPTPPIVPIKIDDTMILEIKDHTDDDEITVVMPKAEILRRLAKMPPKNSKPWKWHTIESTKNWITRYIARHQ